MIDRSTKFKMYGSYAEQVNMLSDQEAGRLFKAVLNYKNGEEPRGLTSIEMMAFSFMKTQMDHDCEVYERICEKNRRNGSKGGRPKKSEQQSASQTESPKAPTNQSNAVDETIISGELSGANMKCEVTARFV